MGHFLYYLPRMTNGEVSRELLAERGLDVALRDSLTSPRAYQELVIRPVHAHGPDGSSGLVVAALPPAPGGGVRDTPQPIGYYADRQDWTNCGPFWLGVDRQHPPEPEDLERPAQIAGYEQVLGDERAWHVPIIRRVGRWPNLPQSMARSPAGEFEMQVLPAYEWAWEAAGRVWEFVVSVGALPWPEVFDLCVLVLSLNYRLGPHEVSRLGLVNTLTFQAVFEAAVDWPKVRELMGTSGEDGKKKAPAQPEPANTSLGPPAGFPSTAPPAEISSS